MSKSEQIINANQFTLTVPEPGCVRVGVLSTVPSLLRQHTDGVLEQVFAALEIEPGLLDYPENSISFALAGQLLESCALHTGIPHFGLLIGQQVGPSDIGQFADLAIYAPDVNSALRNMILHVSVHDRGAAPTLTRDHGTARLGYAIYEPIKEGVKQINDTSISIMCNLMRAMCGNKWAPREVHFSHARPQDITPYESFFHAPLTFDSDVDALLFSDSWLQTLIPSADTQHFNCLLKQFKILESDMHMSLEEKVRSLLRPLIVSHRCTHEHIAAMLAMHPRTLNRRLKSQGTTLRKVVGEIRFEIAKQMLLESEATVTEISTLLGYADSSVLARSFQRWTGITPSAWRIQARDSTA